MLHDIVKNGLTLVAIVFAIAALFFTATPSPSSTAPASPSATIDATPTTTQIHQQNLAVK